MFLLRFEETIYGFSIRVQINTTAGFTLVEMYHSESCKSTKVSCIHIGAKKLPLQKPAAGRFTMKAY